MSYSYRLFHLKNFVALQQHVSITLPLNKHIIYSLPEGLWVFCITLTSKFLFIKIGRREIDLVFVPLFFSIGLELFQLFNITNGRFDWWDIGFAILFWAIAHYLINYKSPTQNILHPFTTRSFVCILSYAIVYLAHVWK